MHQYRNPLGADGTVYFQLLVAHTFSVPSLEYHRLLMLLQLILPLPHLNCDQQHIHSHFSFCSLLFGSSLLRLLFLGQRLIVLWMQYGKCKRRNKMLLLVLHGFLLRVCHLAIQFQRRVFGSYFTNCRPSCLHLNQSHTKQWRVFLSRTEWVMGLESRATPR